MQVRPVGVGDGELRARLLESLLASATDYAILALDVAGDVTVWNEGAHLIMGWTEQEILGLPAATFFTEEDRLNGVPHTEMQAAVRHGRTADERWHLRHDGSRFFASGEMFPLQNEGGAHIGFLKILRDRTAQRLETEKHRAEAEFLRSLLASSGDCIKVLDLDAKLVFMSDVGQQIMEVSDFNAIRGCPWPDFWVGEGNVQARRAIETARAGGVGRFDGVADTVAGNARHWDVQVTPILGADGRPEKLLSVSRDVTATRSAERALREARGLNSLVLESSRDCIVILDLEGRTNFISPGGIEAMEVSDVKTILDAPWLRIWRGEHHAAAQAALAAARNGGTGRFQGLCATQKGTAKWWDVVISPVTDTDGRPEGLVAVARDVTEQHRAESLLRDTEARRRLAVEAADIGTWSLEVGSGALHWDDRCRALFGVPADAEVTYDIYLARIHPDDRERIDEAARAAREPEGAGGYQLEYRTIELEDGRERWIAVAGRTHFEDGEAVRMVGTAMDITIRKRAEEQARLLSEELQHRVKNTLSMVQAIVRQTLRNAVTPGEAQTAIDQRLVALGNANDMLMQANWQGSDLRRAIEAALKQHDDGSAGRFRIDGPAVWLTAQAAMSLSLILNELATNAAKYGALSVGRGIVEVAWTLEAPASLHLVWREIGGPPVRAPGKRGFGSRLIEAGLASALRGRATLSFPPEGVICRVEGEL